MKYLVWVALVALGFSLGAKVVEGYYGERFFNYQNEKNEAIKACEAKLPRDQYCVLSPLTAMIKK